MKLGLFITLFISSFSFSQDELPSTTMSKKGSFYVYWGWNRDLYSTSDLAFKGNDYNFVLHDVAAKDRQSKLDANIYLNPMNFTIPQYNARVGYFISNNYSISIGVDHMKYVMSSPQMTTISGNISKSGTAFDGVYDNSPLKIDPSFLSFEHTDGLNYINSEIRRSDKLFEKGKCKVYFSEGFGAGVVVPRTNCTLMGNPRYDQFNLAGFGLLAFMDLNIEFYDRFFFRTEFKAGFINLPNVRTTMFAADRVKQHFSFLESTMVLGVNLNTKKKKK